METAAQRPSRSFSQPTRIVLDALTSCRVSYEGSGRVTPWPTLDMDSLIGVLKTISKHDPHGILAACCIRLLHQMSNSKEHRKSCAASSSCRPVATLKSTLQYFIGMQHSFETLRHMFGQNQAKSASIWMILLTLVAPASTRSAPRALESTVDLIGTLPVLDESADGVGSISTEDFSICKVHVVEIMHLLKPSARPARCGPSWTTTLCGRIIGTRSMICSCQSRKLARTTILRMVSSFADPLTPPRV